MLTPIVTKSTVTRVAFWPNGSVLKSKASLTSRVAEHVQKLGDYKANPGAHDNKGLLRNAPSAAIRQQIIDGRVKVLEGQITKNQNELAKVEKLLGE